MMSFPVKCSICPLVPDNDDTIRGGSHDDMVSNIQDDKHLVYRRRQIVLVVSTVEDGDEVAGVEAVDLGQAVRDPDHQDPVVTADAAHCLALSA